MKIKLACVSQAAAAMRSLAALPQTMGSRTFNQSATLTLRQLQHRRAVHAAVSLSDSDRSPSLHAARHRMVATCRCSAQAPVAGPAAPVEGIGSSQQQQIDVFVSFLLEESAKYNLTGLSHPRTCCPRRCISAATFIPCSLLSAGHR